MPFGYHALTARASSVAPELPDSAPALIWVDAGKQLKTAVDDMRIPVDNWVGSPTPHRTFVRAPVPFARGASLLYGHMESIGEYLRRHRDAQAMRVSDVARLTRIPIRSIELLESDRFQDLPA